MDKKTLKLLIVELKESGKTYQEISDILLNSYDTPMSRQAVCGMYNRAISNITIKHNKDIEMATSDIINYCAVGCSYKEIKTRLLDNITIPMTEVVSILKSNINQLETVLKSLILVVEKYLSNGYSELDIIDRIQYKGVFIERSILRMLIKVATEHLLKSNATRTLTKIYSATEDRALIKNLISIHNIGITFTDINRALNDKEYTPALNIEIQLGREKIHEISTRH